jgi:predicted phage terminase large subunit-like protein
MSNAIKPCSKFQFDYLKDTSNILVVGGAAGSSKSYVGLMRHLLHIEDPNYRGMCIRKNSTAIMKTGGLFEQSVDLYRQYDQDIKVKLKDQKIVFSSGSSIAFSHYENKNAANLYQGLQLSGIMYDEATHSEEADIWWLISRLRSKANCPHSIWLTCNPDPDSWLLEYVRDYLHPEGHELAGRPIQEKNGNIRWLVRNAGEVVWGETREELIEKYGRPNLPPEHPDQIKPRTFRALFGTVDDNPALLQMQPDYKASLESLPRAECERLRWGNWFARASGSSYWERSWVKEINEPPLHTDFVKIVRAYDFADSIPNELNGGRCDYTACCKMGKLKNGEFVILEVARHHIRFGDWASFILDNARRDGVNTDILLPVDPNPAAKAATQMLAKEITAHGFYVNSKRASTSKLDRFRPFSSATQNGLISIVKGCCHDLWGKVHNYNNFYYKELEAFQGEREINDMADCTADAYMYLASRSILPTNFLSGMNEMRATNNNPLLNIR